MPRYSITNAQFSPFSFEGMLRPYQMATEKYEKQVEDYNKLAEDINAVDYLAQSLPEESPYRKQFNDYLTAFNNACDTLSQGWSPDTASKLLNLRRMYHNTLVPIQKADQARVKSADVQNAIRAKDPSVRFEIDATDPNSLDYFLDNPGASTIKSYSPTSILQSAASQIKTLKEQLYKDNSFESLGEEGALLAKNTLSEEDVANVIQHPELYPNISSIVNTAIDSSGLSNWSDSGKENELSNAWNTALSGVTIGLSAAENPNFIPAGKQIEYGLKQQQLGIQRLRALRSGSRAVDNSSQQHDSVIHKGDTRGLAIGRKAGIDEPRDFPPASSTGRIVKTNGEAPSKRVTEKPRGRWISTDEVIALCDTNTYAGQKIYETVANETRGYLDAFAFYITPENDKGVQTITIVQRPNNDLTVGSYYDYSEDGFDKNYSSEYSSQEEWDAAKKREDRENKRNARKNKEKTQSPAKKQTVAPAITPEQSSYEDQL